MIEPCEAPEGGLEHFEPHLLSQLDSLREERLKRVAHDSEDQIHEAHVGDYHVGDAEDDEVVVVVEEDLRGVESRLMVIYYYIWT